MSTWILLRGLTREARHWGALPDALRAAEVVTRDDALLMPDLPGNGEQVRARSPLHVAGMVAALRDELARRGTTGPYCVLAMSLGGMVATAWAQHFPGEVARLVLINTSMRPFSRAPERLRRTAWPDLLRIATQWRNSGAAEALVHARTCNERAPLAADLAAWTAIRTSAPVSRANALRQLWAAATFRAAREAPSNPVLVLSSRGDQLVDPVCSAQLARAWRVPHIEHPAAGHDLPHDDAAWIAARIHAWTASLDPLAGDGSPGADTAGSKSPAYSRFNHDS
ncbi:alpha/beta fold hydrolase [Paraburkholderia phosphatilytica]|uniref:alpha/beta fold hydrolase n=1 Tax=Paraburkholderia phosphatilytica TaxID=2282883 RepID=UPI000E46804D|nr:alpha/beta hydrolase [Paraburkholderia phosphatilytica]